MTALLVPVMPILFSEHIQFASGRYIYHLTPRLLVSLFCQLVTSGSLIKVRSPVGDVLIVVIRIKVSRFTPRLKRARFFLISVEVVNSDQANSLKSEIERPLQVNECHRCPVKYPLVRIVGKHMPFRIVV